MLRRASDSYLEITFINGLHEFSFDYMKAYTNSAERQLEIYINNILIGTTPIFGSGPSIQPDIYNFSLIELDYLGTVILKIKLTGGASSNRQVAIDNIRWTNNPSE